MAVYIVLINLIGTIQLRILRQLVELQLTNNVETREIIDRAWGVVHNKHRKKETLAAPPEPSDPHSMQRLSTKPIGQDAERRRYWAFDGVYFLEAPPSLFAVIYVVMFRAVPGVSAHAM